MDLRHNITVCTRCKRPLSGFKHYISLKLDTLKEKESGAWENIPSMDLTTNEVVCDRCFDIFTKSIIEETKLTAGDKTNESSAS